MSHSSLVCWAVILTITAAALRAGAGDAGGVTAEHGMVATSHKRAVAIGVEILKRGGNAIDAAIATNAAMGVVEPMSCGMGGDLYAIVWDAKTKKLYGLNASGRSPYAATIEAFEQAGLREIPTYGPLSWSVPGAVDGWDQLRMRFGTMGWDQLLGPAIECAEGGAEVPRTIAGFWHVAETKLFHPDWRKTFLKDGHAPRRGETFVNPYVGRTYREIVAGGRDAFYKGRLAKEIVEFSQREGGLFALRDFEEHTSTWVEPVSATYRGVRVWEIPPPGQGIAALQMLNLIEPFDVRAMGASSADWWQLFIEAKRLVYADRAKYYTDPAFAKVPVEGLISKEYASRRKGLIDLKRAAASVPPGEVALGGDTIYLTVVDKDRNCVSLIQSNYHGFGSGLVPGDLGFALQNRGALFALDRNHANRLEPHRRPFHTIIPAMVTRDERPWFCFGVMGGDMQPQGHVQVLVNLIDFGMDVQAAGDQPRLEHLLSATPTGRAENGVGMVEAEPGVPKEVVDELTRRGQNVKRVKLNGGGYQGILIDWDKGVLHGASESRRDGEARGY
jgi:gamma-glutamyltranspeptidase/glutathione hydrolase